MKIFKLLMKVRIYNNKDGGGDTKLEGEESANFVINKVSPILTQLNVVESEDIDEFIENELASYDCVIESELILPLVVCLEAGQSFFIFHSFFLTKLIKKTMLLSSCTVYDLPNAIFFKIAIVANPISVYNNLFKYSKLKQNIFGLMGTLDSFKTWHKMFGRTINFRRKNAARK